MQTLQIRTCETEIYHLKPIVAEAAKAVFPHAITAAYQPYERTWAIWGRLPGTDRERILGTVKAEFARPGS